MTDLMLPQPIVDLPPSAKLVYYCLDEAGGCATLTELEAWTGTPKSTVWDACKRLEAIGVVESRPAADDARRTEYALADTSDNRT